MYEKQLSSRLITPPFITPRARRYVKDIATVKELAAVPSSTIWYDTTAGGCIGHAAELLGLGHAVPLDRMDYFTTRLMAAQGGRFEQAWEATVNHFNALGKSPRKLTPWDKNQLFQTFTDICPNKLLWFSFKGNQHPRAGGPSKFTIPQRPDSKAIEAYAKWYLPRVKTWTPEYCVQKGVHIYHLPMWPLYDFFTELEQIDVSETMSQYFVAARRTITETRLPAILFMDTKSHLLGEALDYGFELTRESREQTSRRDVILVRHGEL